MQMFAFYSMEIVYSALLCVIPPLLSASFHQGLLGRSQKFKTIYTNFLVEYVNYLKIFLKKEGFVIWSLVIWKTFYKENEN